MKTCDNTDDTPVMHIRFGEGNEPRVEETLKTPDRGKLVDDLAFAVRSLRSEAEMLEDWEDRTHNPRDQRRSAVLRLRERGDLLEQKQRERLSETEHLQ